MTEQSVLRLSDAYESKSEELDLELRIRFININPGYNEKMVEKSPTLYQYVKFVDIVRKYQQEMSFPEAVEKAIDECIKNGILAEFLRKNRAEAVSYTHLPQFIPIPLFVPLQKPISFTAFF